MLLVIAVVDKGKFVNAYLIPCLRVHIKYPIVILSLHFVVNPIQDNEGRMFWLFIRVKQAITCVIFSF